MVYAAESDPAAPPILRRARELAPLLATTPRTRTRRRPRSAQPRRPGRRGHVQLFAPGGLTGADRGLATSVAVFAALGRGCGASAWVSMILSAGGAIASLLATKSKRKSGAVTRKRRSRASSA